MVGWNKKQVDDDINVRGLVDRFVPELVLFPEIQAENRPVDYRNEYSDANEDYHPRSLSLVLDNAIIDGTVETDEDPPVAAKLLRNGELSPKNSRSLGLDIFKGVKQNERQEFWKTYQELEKSHYPVTTYVNAKQSGDLIILQYWLFYIYNDFVNTHEGDWEHVDVLLMRSEGDFTPVECACSSHHGGSRLIWSKVERVNESRAADRAGEHPVVYVALGSHANYFYGGKTFESGTAPDRTTARAKDNSLPPNEVRPEIEIVDLNDGDPKRPWSFHGNWGSPGPGRGVFKHLPILGTSWSGPTSPWTRPAWQDPEKWARTRCHNAGGDRLDFQPRHQRFNLSLGPTAAVLLPPMAHALAVGNANQSTSWRALGLITVISLVLVVCGIRIREHDTLKVFRQRRPAGVSLRKRIRNPRFGWRSRIGNFFTFTFLSGSLLALAFTWYKVVGDASSSLNVGVEVRAVQETEAFATMAGLVPLILLILSTDDDLALVRRGWRRGWSLVLVAGLLGCLIAAEVVALAMLAHPAGSRPIWGFPLIAAIVAASLTVLTWGIGWRIWERYPKEVPQPNELEKAAFWWVGLATLAGISFTSAFVVLEASAV